MIDEKRDDTAAAAHDVAIARAADGCAAALGRNACVCIDHMLHHGLGCAHGVDGIGGLVRGQAYHAPHARVNGRMQDVVRADDIGLDSLHGEKLTGRHLLQRRGMENVVNAVYRVAHRLCVAHIADVEFDLFCMLRMPRLQCVALSSCDIMVFFLSQKNTFQPYCVKHQPYIRS